MTLSEQIEELEQELDEFKSGREYERLNQKIQALEDELADANEELNTLSDAIEDVDLIKVTRSRIEQYCDDLSDTLHDMNLELNKIQ